MVGALRHWWAPRNLHAGSFPECPYSRFMTEDPFRFRDDLGPAKILHLTERTTGLRATVVIDNVAAGEAIGGVRMAVDVTTDECFRLARAMTLKNVAAGLPHGGAKSVIVADPGMDRREKEQLIRAFARSIADVRDYIPGPDMGTNEECMAWVHDEIGRAVGLPGELGGIPLDQIGATGFGLSAAVEVAAEHVGITLPGARVVVQGFGAVGIHAARFLAQRGCVLVGASDSTGAVVNPAGLDVEALVATKRRTGTVTEHPNSHQISSDDLVAVECEVWIPAARPNVLTVANADQLNTRIFAQGANVPATVEAEDRLHERGVLSLPDFIANAGGVICASVEYHGGSEAVALQTIGEKIRRNVAEMLAGMKQGGLLPRIAAERMAFARLEEAAATRRRF